MHRAMVNIEVNIECIELHAIKNQKKNIMNLHRNRLKHMSIAQIYVRHNPTMIEDFLSYYLHTSTRR